LAERPGRGLAEGRALAYSANDLVAPSPAKAAVMSKAADRDLAAIFYVFAAYLITLAAVFIVILRSCAGN
jgi:hypothetical protein